MLPCSWYHPEQPGSPANASRWMVPSIEGCAERTHQGSGSWPVTSDNEQLQARVASGAPRPNRPDGAGFGEKYSVALRVSCYYTVGEGQFAGP
jgi:hypothetical protein